MGDRTKWAEQDRPHMSVISDALNKRISTRIQNLFVQDLQNDCDCSTEGYEIDSQAIVSHLIKDDNTIKILSTKYDHSATLHLPMIEEISEQDIIKLLAIACQQAGNEVNHDISYCSMLYHPCSNLQDIAQALENVSHRQDISLSLTKRQQVALDFVPQDYVYLLPEPSFFGCISAVIGKFGAFCWSQNILKVKI